MSLCRCLNPLPVVAGHRYRSHRKRTACLKKRDTTSFPETEKEGIRERKSSVDKPWCSRGKKLGRRETQEMIPLYFEESRRKYS